MRPHNFVPAGVDIGRCILIIIVANLQILSEWAKENKRNVTANRPNVPFILKKTFCRTFLSFHHNRQTITGIKLKDMRNKHERNDNHDTNTDKKPRRLRRRIWDYTWQKKYLLV